MALAVVLLSGAGLMIRSFLNVYRARIGVNASNVLTMRLALSDAKYKTPDSQIAFYRLLTTRLEAVPGVEGVAITTNLPAGGANSYSFELEGAPPVDERRRPAADGIIVGPGFFRVMQAALLSGREFVDSDGAAGPPVVIVNNNFAARFWPETDPVGKRLRLVRGSNPQPWLTVIGVAPDIADNNNSNPNPILYLPHRQEPRGSMAIAARTRVPPGSLGEVFRREVQALDPNLPVFRMRTLDEQISLAHWPYRIFGSLFAIFAAVALLLASLGLYAVIAHSVSQRTKEIGVRLALGASSAHILRMVFRQGLVQVTIGLVLGLAGAFAVTRVISGLLVQVTPTDPLTFASVSLVLMTAALLGCAIPARRALRVDPVEALRNE
jgi:putative ABC transport system permease protein